MSPDQVSQSCRAKNSIAEESGRPGTSRSKVGCDAIDEPWTNRIVAFALAGSPADLFHRNSFTSPLLVQCSVPARRLGAVILFMNGLSGLDGYAENRAESRMVRGASLYRAGGDGPTPFLCNPGNR